MSKQAFKRVRRSLKIAVNRTPLDSYAWPGGYPIFYLTKDCCALCPDCVNAEIDQIDQSIKEKSNDGWQVVAFDIHWEGEPLICDHCNAEIESAYGVPESEVQS